MNNSQANWSRTDFSRLMGLSTVLSDLTLSPDLLVQIPAFLANSLNLEPTLLAVIAHQDSTASIRWFAHSTARPTPEFIEQGHRRALDVYRQTKPLAAGEAPALRDRIEALPHDIAYSPTAGELVLSRAIDEHHRLLLVVTCHAQGGPSEVLLNTLDLIGSHLVKLLASLVAWTDDPATLGSPFDRLTDREWVVLQAMESEDGEKQLADRLELSPHTLHSHIKSIYRKLGVQGRLPVLLRLAVAQRAVRMRAAAALPCAQIPNHEAQRVVAAG